MSLSYDETITALHRAIPFRGQPQNSTLWHYTDAQGFKGIIETKRIWATHFAHLNDAGELTFGRDLIAQALDHLLAPHDSNDTPLLREIQRRWRDTPVTPDGSGFIASFCADGGNQLSQWRGYGGFGAGYSIGFKSFPARYPLWEVHYVRSDDVAAVLGDVREIVDGAARVLQETPQTEDRIDAAANHATIALAHFAVRIKNHSFSDEKEWRLVDLGPANIEYRAAKRGLVPYESLLAVPDRANLLNLEAVYIGPAYDTAASAGAARHFLRTHRYENADELVRASGITFRP